MLFPPLVSCWHNVKITCVSSGCQGGRVATVIGIDILIVSVSFESVASLFCLMTTGWYGFKTVACGQQGLRSVLTETAITGSCRVSIRFQGISRESENVTDNIVTRWPGCLCCPVSAVLTGLECLDIFVPGGGGFLSLSKPRLATNPEGECFGQEKALTPTCVKTTRDRQLPDSHGTAQNSYQRVQVRQNSVFKAGFVARSKCSSQTRESEDGGRKR